MPVSPRVDLAVEAPTEFDEGMAQITRSRLVRAQPDVIWAVLADFGEASRWADGVDHSCLLRHGRDDDPVGTARRIQVGRDTFVETITEFDADRALAYDIDGLPPPVAASNRWTLHPESSGATTVTLTSTVRVTRGPFRRATEHLLTRVMARRSQALLTSLAITSEGATT